MNSLEVTSALRLLNSKLSPPISTVDQVLRRDIVELVALARSAKVILIHAAAGFGKSTVMLQCRDRLEEMSIPTAWLTLDRADNDVSRFLQGFEAAVVRTTPEEPIDAELSDAQQGLTTGDIALRVMARLTHHPRPFALLLDDFEEIKETGVLGLLQEVIDVLPPGGQIILGSRNFPDLQLGRLRARGQFLEIHSSGLRFTVKETEELLTLRKLPLAREDLVRLHGKTEGWAAALRMAAVALEGSDSPTQFIERFSGSSRSISDYLADVVLAHQPAPVREFLLRTSTLRYLEVALCDAVMGRAGSASILRELEVANLILPLGGDPPSYRYHSLFALFLQSELVRQAPDELPALHLLAAKWYAQQQRPVPAIDHAIEGRDTAFALGLLELHGQGLLANGRMRLLSRWFTTLPPAAVSGSPALQLLQCWASAFTQGAVSAMKLLTASGLENSTDPTVQAHVRALRPLLLAIMDRYEEAYETGRVSLVQHGVPVPFADSVFSNIMAMIVTVMGRQHEALQLVDAARREQGVAASSFNVMYSETNEGIIDLQEGRLRQATARFRIAVSAAHGNTYSNTSGNAWAGVLYAGTVYERNDLEQASHLLRVYLPLVRGVGLPDQLVQGHVMLSRIAFLRGDVDQAFQLLTELEYFGHQRQLFRVVVNAKMERARTLLLQGYIDAARDELHRADDPVLWARVSRLYLVANDQEYMELARLRLAIHAGEAKSAAPQLLAEAALAERSSRTRRALLLRLLHAIALHRAGHAYDALSCLKPILKISCAEGFVRLILDEGEFAAVLVRELEASSRQDTGIHEDPVFVEYVRSLSRAFGPASGGTGGGAAAPALMAEPLTRKEIKVIQLLAEGYSNSAMAEKLFVSDSTVRTHLRNINSKLDTHNRTQAVAVARRLGVIR